jgi:hypothetical protein
MNVQPLSSLESEERPLRDLIAQLSRDGSLLLQQEVALAKTELNEKLAHVKKDAASMAIGGAVLYAGLLTLIASVVLLLALAIPAWVSALLVGLVVTGAGAAMTLKGKKGIEHIDLTPNQSMNSVKTDLRAMKEAVR